MPTAYFRVALPHVRGADHVLLRTWYVYTEYATNYNVPKRLFSETDLPYVGPIALCSLKC